MLKVLCIDTANEKNGNLINSDDPCIPKEGEVYTVIESEINGKNLYYVLREFGLNVGYDAILFVPTSDIDETEMVRENLLVNS